MLNTEDNENCAGLCRYCDRGSIYACAERLAKMEDSKDMVDSIYLDLLNSSIICNKCFTEEYSDYYSDDGA